MIRLGAHASLWTPRWTREAAERFIPDAVKHGLSVIEINPYDLEDRAAIDHSAGLFRRHGVSPVCSIGLPPELGAPTRPKEALPFVTEALDRAARLGAKLLTGLPYATLGYKSGAAPTDAEYDDLAALLRPAARRAAEAGITLGIEVCNRYETHLLNTGAQGAMLQDRVGEPNVIVHLDTYHMNVEEVTYSQGFESVRGRCRYVHLSESNRSVPGRGTVDWDDVFAGLAAIGYDGDLTLESFVSIPDEFKAALCVWRPVAANSDEVLAGLPFLRAKAQAHGVRIS